jgi:hypothetical protein
MSSSGSPVMAGGFASDVYFSVEREMAASAAFPTMINPRDLTVAVSVFGRWEFIPAPGR